MDLISIVAILLIVIVGSVLLFWLARRIKSGRQVVIRPISGYVALDKQIGRAVETGRGIHFTLGRASLLGQANPASIAALEALDYLAQGAHASDTPPVVTSGDGTLLLAAQDSLRGAYREAGNGRKYSPRDAQFLAADAYPMAFAAGASDIVNRGDLGSNIMMGHFGSELAIISEAAVREDMEQVIGSDEPVAVAVGAVSTDKLLIGEEMLAAGAYLQGDPAQIASLQLQDILRVIAVVGILLAALFNFVVG